MVIKDTTLHDAEGISKWGPKWRFYFVAWDTGKMFCCAIGMKQRIPEAQIGIILIKHLTSSTC